MATVKIFILLLLVSVLCMVDSRRPNRPPNQSPRPTRPSIRPNQSPRPPTRPNRPSIRPNQSPQPTTRPGSHSGTRPDRPRNCTQVQTRFSYLSCEPDGSYSPRQCRSTRRCACVNTTNGRIFTQYGSFPSSSNFDCITTFPNSADHNQRCPKIDCDLVCEYRRAVDQNGCQKCSCFLGRGSAMSPANEAPNKTKICEMMCLTVRQLLKQGCLFRCIKVKNNCPICNPTCSTPVNRITSNPTECAMDSDCGENQRCVRVGLFGKRTCSDLPGEGEMCGRLQRDANENSGTMQRGHRVRRFFSRIKGFLSANLPCEPGLICTRVNLTRKECRPENPNGPCVQARVQNPNLTCTENGYYHPLQCKPNGNEMGLKCACVNVKSGEVINSTAKRVRHRLFAPHCPATGFESCTVMIGNEQYEVEHGKTALNLANCSRCLCQDGELQFCESTGNNCETLNASQSCTVNNKVIQHGQRFKVDCKICQCRNGREICPLKQCGTNDPHKNNRCFRCRQVSREPVCGPNGKTYPSRCHATECGNFPDIEVQDGPCNDHDGCELHPCEKKEVCVKKVGVSCLGLMGCRPDDVRTCLKPNDLMCDGLQLEDKDECDTNASQIEMSDNDNSDGDGDDDDDDNFICGSNARSYRSVCHLLQDTGFTSQVRHSGRCDANMCRGGMVCGTDGVTYENICLLRSQAGSTRVDYRGSCENGANDSMDNVCRRIRKRGKCPFTRKNCMSLAVPEEGCCPVCGGVVILAIDNQGLSEYLMLNPDEENTPDDLVQQLEEFFNLSSQCEIEGSLTISNNLELTFAAKDPSDAEYCHTVSGEVAAMINAPMPMPSGGEAVVQPILMQYVSAALTAPLQSELEDDNYQEKEEKGSSGATVLASSASTLLLVVAIFWGLNKF